MLSIRSLPQCLVRLLSNLLNVLVGFFSRARKVAKA